MGKISINDLEKLLKILFKDASKIKNNKKRRRRKKRLLKLMQDNNIKSVSGHITGNVNTHQTNLYTEAMDLANKTNSIYMNNTKAIQDYNNKYENLYKELTNDQNDLKEKADNYASYITNQLNDLKTDQNDLKDNANKYAFNVNTQLNNISNKLNRTSFRPIVDVNDSNDVANVQPEFHAQTKLHDASFNDNSTQQTHDNTVMSPVISDENQAIEHNNEIPAKYEEPTNLEPIKSEVINNDGPILTVLDEPMNDDDNYKNKNKINGLYYNKYKKLCDKYSIKPEEYNLFSVKKNDTYEEFDNKLESLQKKVIEIMYKNEYLPLCEKKKLIQKN